MCRILLVSFYNLPDIEKSSLRDPGFGSAGYGDPVILAVICQHRGFDCCCRNKGIHRKTACLEDHLFARSSGGDHFDLCLVGGHGLCRSHNDRGRLCRRCDFRHRIRCGRTVRTCKGHGFIRQSFPRNIFAGGCFFCSRCVYCCFIGRSFSRCTGYFGGILAESLRSDFIYRIAAHKVDRIDLAGCGICRSIYCGRDRDRCLRLDRPAGRIVNCQVEQSEQVHHRLGCHIRLRSHIRLRCRIGSVIIHRDKRRSILCHKTIII